MPDTWSYDSVSSTRIAISSRLDYPPLADFLHAEEGGRSFEVPGMPQVHEDIWHYTSPEALVNIARTGRLRATSTLMLNDREEIEFGLKQLSEAVDAIATESKIMLSARERAQRVIDDARKDHQNNRVFVICGSLRGDDLSQWRGYGAGYALGLTSKSLAPLSDPPKPGMGDNHVWRWTKVLYSPEAWRTWIDRLAHTILFLHATSGSNPRVNNMSHAASMALWRVIPYLKNAAFKDEAEVRLAFKCRGDFPLGYNPQGKHGITPYIECGIPLVIPQSELGLSWFSYATSEALPLNTIQLGPTTSTNSHEWGSRSLLDQTGYKSVAIIRSEIPFR